MKRPFLLATLAVPFAYLLLFRLNGTVISSADTAVPDDEVISRMKEGKMRFGFPKTKVGNNIPDEVSALGHGVV